MGDLELLMVVFFIAMYLMRLAGTLEHRMTPAPYGKTQCTCKSRE